MSTSAGTTTAKPSFAALLTASGVSNLADGIFKVALPILAAAYTRSPALVALATVLLSLPWLVGSLHIGALVDRYDRHRIMQLANCARAGFLITPTLAIATDHASLWLLYLSSLGIGFAEVFYDNAAQSILPSVVESDSLDRANSQLQSVELTTQQFIGPPAAGVLVAFSLSASLAVPMVLWLVAVGALRMLRGEFTPVRRNQSSTIAADIREGLSYLLANPLLRNMAIMVGIANLATNGAFSVFVLFALGPESDLQLTEPQFGLLLTTTAAGAIFGGVVTKPLQRLIGRSRTLTLTLVGMVVFVAVPALTTSSILIGAVFIVGGATMMIWNVITVSFRQRVIPDGILGRANSVYRLFAWGTMPLGAVIGGLLGETLGLRSVFVAMAIFSLTMFGPNRVITDKALDAAEREASR